MHDVAAALHDLAELKISSATTEADAAAAMRELAAFNGCAVGLVRFSGETPWERHSEDELLYILEGEVELMVMMDAGPVQTHAREGCVVVVPRDAWHRQLARSRTTLLFVTGGTDVSTAEDPRG